MPEKPEYVLRTFLDQTPKTSDVVLCHYCGCTLHAPEHDVFWEDGAEQHRCAAALEDVIRRLTA